MLRRQINEFHHVSEYDEYDESIVISYNLCPHPLPNRWIHLDPPPIEFLLFLHFVSFFGLSTSYFLAGLQL